MGETRSVSPEEEDNLNQSIKKPKGLDVHDDLMDDNMHSEDPTTPALSGGGKETLICGVQDQGSLKNGGPDHPSGGSPGKSSGQGRRVVSYKDKLLRLNGAEEMSDSEDEDWLVKLRKEEEEEDAG